MEKARVVLSSVAGVEEGKSVVDEGGILVLAEENREIEENETVQNTKRKRDTVSGDKCDACKYNYSLGVGFDNVENDPIQVKAMFSTKE
ncbi:hypothetical protein Tco_1274626 [Tanacetum coccineum]